MMAIHDTFPDQGRKNPVSIQPKIKVRRIPYNLNALFNILYLYVFSYISYLPVLSQINTVNKLYRQVDSRVFSVAISAWDGTKSKRGIGGRYHKCDKPDPKLLVRRPVRMTLGLKSGTGRTSSWKKKVGRSLKFHEELDESKVLTL